MVLENGIDVPREQSFLAIDFIKMRTAKIYPNGKEV